MNREHHRHPAVADALRSVDRYVTEVTGRPPTSREVAAALKRYFVLKEIGEHIELDREQAAGG